MREVNGDGGESAGQMFESNLSHGYLGVLIIEQIASCEIIKKYAINHFLPDFRSHQCLIESKHYSSITPSPLYVPSGLQKLKDRFLRSRIPHPPPLHHPWHARMRTGVCSGEQCEMEQGDFLWSFREREKQFSNWYFFPKNLFHFFTKNQLCDR